MISRVLAITKASKPRYIKIPVPKWVLHHFAFKQFGNIFRWKYNPTHTQLRVRTVFAKKGAAMSDISCGWQTAPSRNHQNLFPNCLKEKWCSIHLGTVIWYTLVWNRLLWQALYHLFRDFYIFKTYSATLRTSDSFEQF